MLPGNPLLPVKVTAPALLAAWDRAASGWSLHILIHTDEKGLHYVFIRGDHALIKHPELAADGGVIRGDYKGDYKEQHKDKVPAQGNGGSEAYGSGGSSSGYADQWKGQTDPWTANHQHESGWSTGWQS
jgi:hypothetical protein